MTHITSVLTFVAVVLGWMALAQWLDPWFDARRERAAAHARQLRLPKPSAFDVWGAPLVAVGCFLGLTLTGAWMPGLVLGAVMFKVVDAIPGRAARARIAKFDAQLSDALVGLANSLRAGLALPQAVEQVAGSMPAPMSQEMGQVFHEYELGKTIEQAFEDVTDRIPSRNFELAVAAFRVGKERGGNLSEVFSKIAQSIREIWRLEENVRTVTTQGRSSARFMTMMPAVFLVLLYFMDPEGVTLLFTDPIGIGVLTVVFLITLAAHVWIQKILAVEV